MNFGERVRRLRERKGLNQLELAKSASTTPATISRIENGVIKELKQGALSKLADALGVPIDYLIGRTHSIKLGEFIELDEEASWLLRKFSDLTADQRLQLRTFILSLDMQEEFKKLRGLKKQLPLSDNISINDLLRGDGKMPTTKSNQIDADEESVILKVPARIPDVKSTKA